MRRPLSALEIPYVVTNTTSGGGFVVRGELDIDRLRAAGAALRREFPFLTGRFEATAEGFDLVVGEAPRHDVGPPTTVAQGPFAPSDVIFDIDPEVSLCALHVKSDGDLHRVSVGANHAVADGACGAALNLRLWELYTDPAVERAPRTELPHPPLTFASRLGEANPPQHPSIVAHSVGAVPTVAAVDAGEFGYARIKLDQQATAELRGRAKAAGLRLHGLLAALIVLAERDELAFGDDEAVAMAVFSPVDLRWRCDPAIDPVSVTNFAGSSTTALAVRADTPPEEIGHAVLDRIVTDLSDGTAVATLTGAGGVQITSGAPIRLSNLGMMAEPTLPPELTAVDFYTSSDVDIDRVRLLVRTLPPEALAALVGFHYHAVTFQGCLSIEVRYAPGTVDRETAERVRQRLEDSLVGRVGAAA